MRWWYMNANKALRCNTGRCRIVPNRCLRRLRAKTTRDNRPRKFGPTLAARYYPNVAHEQTITLSIRNLTMSKTISWNLQMNVREGQLDKSRDLMHEMVTATREEPGTLGYEWFLSDDGKSCHINERYEDSEAVLTHLGSFGANFVDRFLACFEPTSLSVYGNPSAEARAALDGFGAAYLGWLGGFAP